AKDVHQLTEDVELELAERPQAESLVKEMRGVDRDVAQLNGAVQRANAGDSWRAWQQFTASWERLAPQVKAIDSRHVARSASRVAAAYDAFAAQFGTAALPGAPTAQPVDLQSIAQLTSVEVQQFDALLQKISLATTLQMADPPQFLADAHLARESLRAF